MNEKNKNEQIKYQTISKWQKFCFGFGALGKDANCNMISCFYMLFLTDTLFIDPAFIGVLFFVARIWDAINDPMMGMIVDNTHTKYGKFRIWLSVGTIINSIVLVAMFKSFELQGTALYVFVAVTYIIYGMTYTIMDVPYWSWLPNLTNDPREREKVSVIPRIFASAASFLVGTFGLYVINWFNKLNNQSNSIAETGFTWFAVLIAIVFIFTISVTVFNVKEKPTSGIKNQKTSFKQAIHIIVKNDQLLAFIGLLLAYNLCTTFVRSFAVYYFKNVCNNQFLYSAFAATFIAEMAGLFCMPYISKKAGRATTFKLACTLPIIGLVLLGTAGCVIPQNVVAVVISSAIFLFGSGLSTGVTTCCMADVIDYGELKFGVRNESITCSTQTFLMKFALAMAGLFTGFGLKIVGYDAKLAVQSSGTIMGIRILMLVLPIMLVIISYIVYHKFGEFHCIGHGFTPL
ncbi:MAG: melibiose:sodium transporter MelB [Eubacteriales bacterium]|nr:melibiose:sodium transporter MelB [Eubacteriales bacterium]